MTKHDTDAGSKLIVEAKKNAEKPDKPARKAPAATPTPTTERTEYEVVGTLSLGRKMGVEDLRRAGDKVYNDELEPEMLQHLLTKGEIVDRNKPLPPTQASQVLAFDHLLDVATKVGAVTVNGGAYQLGDDDETTYAGIAAFRAAVSIEQLKEAIVEEAQ